LVCVWEDGVNVLGLPDTLPHATDLALSAVPAVEALPLILMPHVPDAPPPLLVTVYDV